jgi:hypothetical protein
LAAVPIKLKTMALQEKLNIMQKVEENVNNLCSEVYVNFIQILGGPLQLRVLLGFLSTEVKKLP